MTDRARHDINLLPTLIAVSSSDGESAVTLWADPVTHALVTSGGSSGGGGAVTVADGADVAEGAVADAAVTAGSAGTVSGKLRTISADISTIKGTGIPITGTVSVTQSGTWTLQPGNTANTTPWLVKNQAFSVSSQTALTGTATVSGAAGVFAGGSFMNLNSAPAYLQFFDTTSAVTLGTTTPTFVQPIPANSTAANGAAFVFHIPGGITLANGLKVAATTTATGATTVSTGLTGYVLYQ